MRTRTLLRIGLCFSGLVVGSALVACNGDSGGNVNGGSGATDGGGGPNSGGANGGGNANGGGGGATGRTDAGCGTPSTFNGQPGTLWVDTKEGDLIGFDTKDGHRLTPLPAPAPRNGVVGGGGLLWIWGPGPASDITPMQPSGQTQSALSIQTSYYPLFGAGKLWVIGPDDPSGAAIPSVFAIASPPSVTTLHTNYAVNASAVNADGYSMLGAIAPVNPEVEVVHIDTADAGIVWHVPVTTPGLQNWPQTDGEPSMAVLPGKIYVKTPVNINPTTRYDEIFVVDVATHAVGAPAKLDFNPGNNGLVTLVSDGTGLYALDDFNSKVYEIDPSTFAQKRALALPDDADEPINGPLVAAGALWLTRQCGGTRYVRRVDLGNGSVADLPVPEATTNGLSSYAYLTP